MTALPAELTHRLHEHGQEHLLDGWDRLSPQQQANFQEQLSGLDLFALRELYQKRDTATLVPAAERIEPIAVIRQGADETAARSRGEAALRVGQVACVLVAGGQGTRLGFDQPKGMFGIGPVTNKSLFQIHAEKVLALTRRYGKAVPLLVMTSEATHDATIAYFEEHQRFGLQPADLIFFKQGTMPALDLETGRLLLEAPGRLFAGPNGHGGTLTALNDSGLLDRLAERGIEQIFYFQVDNPLIKMADPGFLGHHLLANGEASSKVVAKTGPAEKTGVFASVDGRCTIIEYSDLPAELAAATDAQGRLKLWAGNPAIHLFSVPFLRKVTRGALRLPFHIARKKVPYLGADGTLVKPTRENALKFEMFIFDALPLADRWTVVETARREEFAPVKNADGVDSPATSRQALSDLAADWLQAAGVAVPRQANGSTPVALEISPLLALDASEFAEKMRTQSDKPKTIESARYFE